MWTVQDETLRDGLQSPSVVDPSLGEKIELLHAMEALAVDVVNVGLPAASSRNREHVRGLCDEIARARLRVRPAAAGRTVVSDLVPIAEAAQATGMPIVVAPDALHCVAVGGGQTLEEFDVLKHVLSQPSSSDL